jgi:arginine utilization protein RocB
MKALIALPYRQSKSNITIIALCALNNLTTKIAVYISVCINLIIQSESYPGARNTYSIIYSFGW